MDQARKFRVVVVYENGTREVRARNLTLGAAQAVEATLIDEKRFAKVLLETEHERDGDGRASKA